MPRELSKAEQAYILANYQAMDNADICGDMPGVGVKTVEQFLEANILPEASREETPEEHREKVRKRTGLTAGKQMIRDPKRGIAVMTEGASEIIDAHRPINTPDKKRAAVQNNDRVFIMDPSKPVS